MMQEQEIEALKSSMLATQITLNNLYNALKQLKERVEALERMQMKAFDETSKTEQTLKQHIFTFNAHDEPLDIPKQFR